MDPAREIPRLFDTWDKYVREAGICESLAELDFLEIHSFGAAPKEPSPITDPAGFAAEKKRIRQAYREAYAAYWREKMPDSGLPVRFTVYLEELPDSGASYEMGATALYQRSPKAILVTEVRIQLASFTGYPAACLRDIRGVSWLHLPSIPTC